jgi:hypothetical protein
VLDFLHGAMLLLAMHLCLCHREVEKVLAFVHGAMYSLAIDLLHSAMLFLAMHLWMCYKES